MRIGALLVIVITLAACAGQDQVATTTTTAPTVPTTSDGTTTSVATTTTGTPPPPTTTAQLQGLRYSLVADGVAFPMLVTPWGDRSLVALRDGRVLLLDELDGDPVATVPVSLGGERGLLGMDVDGDRLYVHYSDTAGDTAVSEIDLGSGQRRDLLSVAQPAANHNGGMLQFGPGGALYLGLGDGGGANDQFGHGQNTDTLLGGIVRIDPATGDSTLWSYGLRNPYRFWIDGDTFYIADVGQNAFEEIDVVTFDPDGYNFGWPITEGTHCFSPRTGCDPTGITLPVVEIEHGDDGACSITGGVVYRGTEIPELTGHFLFSDYCGGWLRSLAPDGNVVDWTDDVGVPGPVVSFGVDHLGEVYVLTPDSILRLEPIR